MSLSIIIIGRNEGEFLSLSLQSAFNALEANEISGEVLYVDSQSTDGSLEVAKRFEACRVLSLTGDYNSAIARNVGAKEAIYSNLLFMDGDMELQADFLPIIVDNDGDLKFEFVSGNFINYYYSPEGDFLSKDFYRKVYCHEDAYQATTGGLFAIRKALWQQVGGMQAKFVKGQDLDLGYRLAKRGHLLLRKAATMAFHHTVSYKDSSRMWSGLVNGTGIYPRAILYRSHLLNKYVLKRMLTSDPTLILLVLSVCYAVCINSWWPGLIYPGGVFLAVLASIKKINGAYFERVLIQLLRDFMNVGAFLFFFPTNTKNVNYETIQ